MLRRVATAPVRGEDAMRAPREIDAAEVEPDRGSVQQLNSRTAAVPVSCTLAAHPPRMCIGWRTEKPTG
jgi:hypothetical protein